MRKRLAQLRDRLETSIWVIPAACLLGAVLLSFAVEALDKQLADDLTAWYLFQGGPDGARSILSSVASALMTLTGVVFSVTILVLQLASTQFSPRVLRTFLQDRGSQMVLGVFVGTFLYALLGLRSVKGESDGVEEYVPALSIWLCVVLTAACIASFVYFIHHIAQSIRAVNVLHRIGDDARAELNRSFPDGLEGAREPVLPTPVEGASLVIPLGEAPGVIFAVDERHLVACAQKANVVIRLIPAMGDFVPYGAPLVEVFGDAATLDVDEVLQAIVLGRERSVRGDLGFALRELVDVAERALSSGVNDPTTAVQALDQLHDILRRLVSRAFPPPYRLDDEGRVRLLMHRADWDAYVRLAVDEIRQYGDGSIQIARRLRALLEDLLTLSPPSRRGELQRQLAMLNRSVSRSFEDADDEAVAMSPSAQGHGTH